MDIDYLKKLKSEISKLSDEELKKRDLYLKKLASGELQGPPVGYMSIDKPWLKYYDDSSIMLDFKPMSIYDLMHESNIGHENDTVINYFGKKVTYKELEKNIDIVAKALLELGVQKGDIVMMNLPNIPEAEYVFYAVNKIGAILEPIDPRTNEENILKDVKDSNAKLFISLNIMNPKLAKVEDVKIVPVSPYNSLPFIMKKIASLKEKKGIVNLDNQLSWDEFIKLGKNSNKTVESVFEPNETAIIIHTGGSTGVPKGVKLTNENFNGLIYQLMNNKMNFRRGSTFLNILPPFIALGLDNAMHLAACLGIESILIPSFEPEDIPKLVDKHKPNVLLCGPIHCLTMMNSDIMKNKDLSYLEILCSGGDKMPREDQEAFQTFLKDHNAKANTWLGYGATETSAGSSCMTDECFRYESVGVPYLKNVFAVYDTDTNEEVYGPDKIGELRINAPTLMQGYFGVGEEETNKVLYTDENGTRWYLTGDLSHFDKDGLVYIDGRIKRIITRRGFKIYPLYVEELIMRHPAIKQCAVVGVEDPKEINIPVANIVLKDEYKDNEQIKEEVINYINDIIEKNLPEYSMMAGFNFLDEMPLTPIGKLDFKALEKMGIISSKEKQMQKRFDILK